MAGGLVLVRRSPLARTGREHQRYICDIDGPVRLVAGCVPLVDGKVVMISSGNNKWIVPKGGWETDETAEAAACREAYEEAGVIGVLGSALSEIEFLSRKRGGRCRLYLWVMHVTEILGKWPEASDRRRRLVSLETAIAECSRPEMREALIEMRDRGLHLGGKTVTNVQGSDYLACGDQARCLEEEISSGGDTRSQHA